MTSDPISKSAVRLDLFLSGVTLCAMIWLFHWVIASSGGFQPPGEEDYYNFQVQGWLKGTLHMSKSPSPELIALKDPYDPAQNSALRMADASYYRGHYYLYFGAAPALVLLYPYALITGKALGTTHAIFLFCSVGLVAASTLWWALRRRYFPESAAGLGALGILLLGCGTHLFTLQRRPLVWELPIASAYAFSMLAFLALYWAFHGRRPVLAMGLAGLFMGLTVASRPTCILGAVALVVAVWHLRKDPSTRASWLRAAWAAAVPLAVVLAAMLAHNYARFDNPLEFGTNYSLTGAYESKMKHFSWSYMPINSFIYFLHPAEWSGTFPFIKMTAVRGGPPGYMGDWNETLAGLLVSLPMLGAACAAPFRSSGDPARAGLRTLVYMLGIYCLVMCAIVVAFFVATSRYMVDFTPTLGILALIGWMNLEAWARQWTLGRFCNGLLVLLCVATVAVGIAISFIYHDRSWLRGKPPGVVPIERFFQRLGF